MTKLLFLFLLVVFANANELVKLHINKNHALLTFVESLCDVKYASKVPKRMYVKMFKDDLSKLKKFHLKLSRSRIYNHLETNNLLEAIYIESLKSDTLEQLEKSILKHHLAVKNFEVIQYFNILEKLLPKYESIIWNSSLKKLKTRIANIKSLMEQHDFNKLVYDIATFYGVPRSQIGTLDLAFYPIPSGNNINAYRIKNLETIGVLVNKNQNLKWLLSATILHEVSHSIYYKSRIIKENFLRNESKKDKTIYQETFATAIGAGWGYHKLTNTTSRTSWYNNKIYDKAAKRIYPKLIKYLNKNKVIDKNFIDFVKGQKKSHKEK